MSAGNIFVIMMNDGKQNLMLNATEKLQQRLDEINRVRVAENIARDRVRFATRATADPTWAQDREVWARDPTAFATNKMRGVHQTLSEITRTHNVFINAMYKPFVAMSYSYLKVLEKEGQPQFGGTFSYTIPQFGTWIGDMVLHVRLTGLHCTDARDKAKYCSMLGHRLVEQARFMVNNIAISEYGTEHINKYYQFHVTPAKRTAWLRNVGQEIPHMAYVTPDPKLNEYREYRWFGDGAQTLKRSHDEVDMYIPLLFWFNLDIAQSFPNCKVAKGGTKVQFKFAELAKLIAVVDYDGGGAYTPPAISTCDLYVNHINTLPEIEELMMRDYMYSLVRVPKSMSQTLNVSDGAILLKDLKFPVEHFAVSFRPVENLADIDVWHRNVRLTIVDILQPTAIMRQDIFPAAPALAINYAQYFTEEDVVNTVGIKIKDIEIHPVDTVKKYSSYHPMAAAGMVAPEDRGWLLFTNQFYQQYDPSGYIDLSRNREVYLQYSGDISNAKKVQLYVEAQCINFIMIKQGNVNLKYNI